MKKILLLIFTLAIIGLSSKLDAQCTLSNLNLTLNSAIQNDDGDCVVTMTLEFDMDENGGNKYTYINIWRSTEYNLRGSYAAGQKGPTWETLKGTSTEGPVVILGIEKPSNSTYNYSNTYTNDPTNINLTNGRLKQGSNITRTPVSSTVNHYVLTGIQTIISGGCADLVLQGDIWGSQNPLNGNQSIHCLNAGVSFFGDPTIQGGVNCTEPNNTFTVDFSTVSSSPFVGNYKVYIDNGVVGTYEPGTDVLAYTHPTTVSFSATIPYNSGQVPYDGNDVNPTYTRPLLVELITSTPISDTYYYLLENGCSPLPVKLKSFTASRKQTNVELKWTTTLEQNNSGFELQRQSGAGGWQKIGFVNSKATDGNSVSDLNYAYTDVNDSRGVSQYRLMQVDLDDNAKYSDIRSVQGIGQEARTIISPNPSANGRVNVTFQSANSKKDLQLTDMHGRMLKQWNAYSDNSLQITDLTPGIYQLRIVDRETGTQTVEKIMVVNR